MTQRVLRHYVRGPLLVWMAALHAPVDLLMIWLLFSRAIGQGFNHQYIYYLTTATLVQVAVFGGMGTAVAEAADRQEGFSERLASLPVSRAAMLFARPTYDLLRNACVLGIVVALGLTFGFRFEQPVWMTVVAFLLVLGFGILMSFICQLVGRVVSNGSTAHAVMNSTVLPLFFVSNAIVSPGSVPHWLRPVIRYQPVSTMISIVRALLLTPSRAAQIRVSPAVGVFARRGLIWLVLIGLLIGGLWMASVHGSRHPLVERRKPRLSPTNIRRGRS